MSNLFHTAQDTLREQCIEAWVGLQSMVERMREQRGQTAAEYMGILFIIAAIIGVVASLHLENDVSQRIKTLITDIGKGIKP
jgi:Flp pilus assembly pilin Flp